MKPVRSWLHTLLCTSALGVLLAGPGYGYWDLPPTGKTGAPGHNTCASCHTLSSGGNGSVAISFSGGSEYKAGELYTLMVTVTDPEQLRFGFSMVARDTDDGLVDVGTWSVVPGSADAEVHGPATNPASHVSHKNAPSEFEAGEWTFTVNWTAPPQGVDDVTFHAAGLAADFNDLQGNDHVYTTSLTISEANSQAPVISALSIEEDGAHFTLTGVPGTYMVQYYSGSGPGWEDLKEVILTTGSASVIDESAAGLETRLYRAAVGNP